MEYQGRLKKLKLPLLLGSNSEAHIIISTEALAPISYCLDVDKNQQLVLVHAIRKEIVSLQILKELGIHVVGPYRVFKNKILEKLNQTLSTILSREKFFWTNTKKFKVFRGLFLVDSRPLMRFGVFCLIISVISFLNAKKELNAMADMDRSATPIALEANQIFPYQIISDQSSRSYAKGVMFRFQLGESDNKKLKYQLKFSLRDIDHEGEIWVKVRERYLFESKIKNDCLSQFCTYQIAIPEELIPKDQSYLDVQFVHRIVMSNYRLKSVVLNNVRPLEEEDIEWVESNLVLLSRYIKDSEISLEFIRQAKELRSKLKVFLNTHAGGEVYHSKLENLSKILDDNLEEKIKELLVAAERAYSLGQLKEAKEKLTKLSSICSSKECSVFRKISELEDLIQEKGI